MSKILKSKWFFLVCVVVLVATGVFITGWAVMGIKNTFIVGGVYMGFFMVSGIVFFVLDKIKFFSD